MSFDDLERDLGISYSYQDEEEEQEQKNGMQILVKVLVNERRAPELLQYDQELVDSVKRKIKEQQDLVDQLSANESSKIAADLMQLEIDRIQYVLTSYLRTRLLKIQRFVMHVLTNEAVLERLSPAEFAFASKYVDVVAENFTLGFLQNIPERFRALDDDSIQPSMVESPDLSQYVISSVLSNIGDYRYGKDDIVHLNRGDILIGEYQEISGLLESDLICLL